ncbi:MAG: hypothetical protein KAV01_06620, partial [Candidatus Lokiarchaeota archaeon]|nr:hypothetical protein [Candidatus Lokiarchaeota archaeon]
PWLARSSAAFIPAIPPPTTSVAFVTGTVLTGTTSKFLARSIPLLTSIFAFFKASELCSVHQETCSRIFTIWK